MTQKTILIVDDETDIRNLVKEILQDEGYATLTAANSKEAYAILETHKPDMAVLDIWLQDSRHDGLQILQTIKDGPHAAIPAIMISGHGTIETAVSAIKQGAYDFIEKPFKSDRLILMVRRGLEAALLQQENAALKAQNRQLGRQANIIGSSTHAKTMRERVKALAVGHSRLLIEGPLGGGKTSIARLIHNASDRSEEPFHVYICGQNAEYRGSLGDAVEKAKGGTLVLQDVNALSEADQKAVVKILQDSETKSRVIGTLRESASLNETLRQRLSVEHLVIPSLSERKSDIADILEVFVAEIAEEIGIKAPQISPEFVKFCEKYEWVGNLYELKAALIWALVHNDGADVMNVDALPARITGRVVAADNVEILNVNHRVLDDLFIDLPLRDARDVFEREYLTSQVERFEGNISKTAQFIGMERSALHRKIKSLQDKDIQDETPEQQAAAVKK
ncbi:MAG: sigma-54-dependent Fis family transcriptional regulator [Alphaproteobacteria bacterium]|nr:sigma-54-dependent Fis family transcriptional regulator [Alphaproteobacteria bacterium]